MIPECRFSPKCHFYVHVASVLFSYINHLVNIQWIFTAVKYKPHNRSY